MVGPLSDWTDARVNSNTCKRMIEDYLHMSRREPMDRTLDTWASYAEELNNFGLSELEGHV